VPVRESGGGGESSKRSRRRNSTKFNIKVEGGREGDKEGLTRGKAPVGEGRFITKQEGEI